MPQILIGAAALLLLVLLVMAVRFLMQDTPDDDVASTPREGPSVSSPERSAGAGTLPESDAPTERPPAEPARDESRAGSFADRLANAGASTSAATAAPTTVAARRAVESAPAAVPASGVTLRFSDECWYEVRDANGRRVATGTGQAGQSRTVRGERPLAITLGYADGAEVIVDGETFEIPSAARRGRRAIFSVP